MRQLWKQFVVGLRRRPFRLVVSAFLTYCAIWTILESSSFLFPSLEPQGWLAFSAMLPIGIGVGVYRGFPQKNSQIRIKSIDTAIEVEFGDLFEAHDPKVIPVNEFFNSEPGDPVSPHNLHGQLIGRLLGGHPASIDALVEEEPKGQAHEQVTRTKSKEKRYPIGTTPVVNVGEERFFLRALCHTDLATVKASCDVPTLWKALTGLWSGVRNRTGGAPVSEPLIAGGLAEIGLPPSQLLQLILLSIVTASRERHITRVFHIVLPWKCFGEIDLEPLNELWI